MLEDSTKDVFQASDSYKNRATILVRGSLCDYDNNDAIHKTALQRIIGRFLHYVLSDLKHPTICLPLAINLDIYIAHCILNTRKKRDLNFSVQVFPVFSQHAFLAEREKRLCDELLHMPDVEVSHYLARPDALDYIYFFNSGEYALYIQYGQDAEWTRIARQSIGQMFSSNGDLEASHVELHNIETFAVPE